MRARDPLLNAHLADPAIDDALGWTPRVPRLVWNIDLQRWFPVAAVLVLFITALVVSPPISVPNPFANTPVRVDDATDFDGAAIATSSLFEPNGGRFDPAFDYVLRSETGSTSVMVGAGQMALALTGEASTSVATMSFVGADSTVSPTPTGEGATLNYMFGDDPTAWQTGLTTAGAIEYTDVIGTADLRYLAVDQGFRFDVQIEAGGDPDDVLIDVDGAELSILETGDLELRLPGGLSTVYSAPIAFQEIDGQRRDVAVEFDLVDSETIGFSVGSYDAAHPLVIDPTIDFSTTIGGADADVIEDVAVDNFGTIYIVGTTDSTDFPTTVGTYDQTSNGLNDVFVSHYAADGTTLLWSTYVGGSQNDEGIDLALARDGDVVVTGLTSSANFPTTLGAFDTTSNGGSDAFVLELSDDGTTLIASTYLGGSLAEVPTSLDIGRTGEIVVGGSAVSANFPTTGGAYDSTNPDAVRDGFVSSFSPALAALNWSTYVGASGDDFVNDVSIDPTGAVYVAFVARADMPTTAGAFDTTRADGDAWIARLSTNGQSLEYATYLGGSGDDEGVAILYEADDRVHVGSTARAGFPTTVGAFEETAQTAVDAAYTLLDPTATGSAQLVYSTFLGGLDGGPVYDIDLDTAGRVYLVGRDNAGGLATVNAPDPTHGGGGDGFLAVFDAAGVRQLHTYFGDVGDNYASGIAVDGSDRPVVVGPESASLTTNSFITRLTTLNVDTDGDGLWDNQEDANTDADNDPATTPGTDTDTDGNANYNDADDDGDGIPTASENADPNADGDPRDAVDTDADGESDYLDAETNPARLLVASDVQITDTENGGPALDDDDYFGEATAAIGDINGDGIVDLAVGARGDDDTGGGGNGTAAERGAVYILFMNSDGTVATRHKISDASSDLSVALDQNDQFGGAVAGIGDLDGDGIPDIAVGAIKDNGVDADQGVVYVLFLNADGTVRADQRITEGEGGFAALLAADDSFGSAITGLGDFDGDGIPDIAVGARGDDDGTGGNKGSIYLLMLNANGTVKNETKISEDSGGFGSGLIGGDNFGRSLAALGDLDGDGVVDLAAGVLADAPAFDAGAVYIIFLNANGTVKSKQLIDGTGAGGLGATLDNSDQFGRSVGALGDVDRDGNFDLVVGAFNDDHPAGADAGAAYVLLLNSNGTVRDEQRIRTGDGGFSATLLSGDRFGAAAAGIGDLNGNGTIGLAIGADLADGNNGGGSSNRGAVWVLDLTSESCFADTDADGIFDCYEDADTDLDQDPTTTPGPDTDGDSNANYNDADDDDDGLPTASENADPNADGKPQDAQDEDKDGEPDYLDIPAGTVNPEAATLQKISDFEGGFTPALTNDDSFGQSVAGIGDIDGDGINDIAVGAPGDDDDGSAAGAVYVLLLDADGSVSSGSEVKINATSGEITALDPNDNFGESVAGVGDIDGDGINDLAVGAPGDDDEDAGSGAVYILFLHADGTVKAEQKISDTAGTFDGVLDALDGLGTAISNLGDLDGNGVNDIAVGVPGDDDEEAGTGAVYILFLNNDGTVNTEQKISDTAGDFTAALGTNDEFGTSVANLGDVNGDGVTDIAVGAIGDDSAAVSAGAVHILFLDTDGTVDTDGPGSTKLAANTSGFPFDLALLDRLGRAVAGVGDLDDNGTPDIVVGADSDDEGGGGGIFDDHGAIYVVYLDATGSAIRTGKVFDDVAPLLGEIDSSDNFGSAIASMGDLDSDGSPGIAVGAINDDDGTATNNGTDRGAVYLLEFVAQHTVNSTGDAADLSLADGVCHTGVNNSEGDPECTLRAAIAQANASTDRANIEFAIPASDSGHTTGVWRIEPATLLPSITTTVSIDASTQPGYTTTPVIELYGNGGAGDGFSLSGSSSSVTIRGFALGGFSSNDLQLFGDDHLIAGNYFGLTADGISAFPIETNGASVLVQAGNGVTIGGTTAADRNVIGNAPWGVAVNGSLSTSALTISGNYIGVDATGGTVAPVTYGIDIYSGVSSVVVGGGTPSSGNVLAATFAGVRINGETTDGVTVSNNSIGVAANGVAATQAGQWGVWVEDGSDNTVISNNVIGNATDQAVRIAGVSTGTQITSNLIGIGTDGGSHPVTEAGIVVRDGATGSIIGGTSPVDGNTITNTGGDGVRILSGDHTVLGNSIYGNAGLGIDHGDDGVTLPDSGDVDGVPNQPVLLGATESSGTTTIDLALDAPVGTYEVQYFDNPSGASTSGYGEGETLIASVSVEITTASPAVFRHVVPGNGLTLAATATRSATGGTSEFSNAIDGATAGPLRIEDLSIRRSDLTKLGGAPTYVTGAAADAIALDGTDDFLVGPGLDVTDGELALSASVFVDTLSGDDTIISKRASDGGIIYELGIDGATGEAVAAIDVTGTPIEVRGGTITTSTWQQIDAVWDGATFTLYVDGVAVDTSPAVGTLDTDVLTRVAIGARSDGSRALDGAVDNVQVGHGSNTSARIAARQANLDGGGFITVGDEQTNAPGAWATSGAQTRSGSFSLSAPETTGPGSAGWAVARDIDEPGIVFESYWYLTQATNLDIASGTRATVRQIDQYSGAAVGSSGSVELRQPSGDTDTVDASAVSTIPTGRWVPVEIWTDQLGDTRLFIDGIEVIGWTSQGSTLTSGSAGLLVNELPIGEAWYIDDARARKLVTPEPTTSLGALDRK